VRYLLVERAATPERDPSVADGIIVQYRALGPGGGDARLRASRPREQDLHPVERVQESQPYGRWLNAVWPPPNC